MVMSSSRVYSITKLPNAIGISATVFCVSFLACRTSLALAQAPDKSVEQVKTIAETIEAQLRQIRDMSCVLTVWQSGTESPESIQNAIRKWEIGKARGYVKPDEAEKELAELREAARKPPSVATEPKDMQWRVRQDGLFWMFMEDSAGGNKDIRYAAYDGTVFKSYDPVRNRGGVRTTPQRPSNDVYFGINVYRMSIDKFLNLALEKGTVAYEESSVSPDGAECVVTAIIPGDAKNKTTRYAKLWLQPTKGFMPKRIESGIVSSYAVENPERLVSQSMYDVSCQELAPGVWFPISGTFSASTIANLADPDKPLEQWKLVSFPGASAVHMSLKEINVNQGLQEKDFRIDFAPGTVIYDELSGSRLASGGIDKTIDRELAADTTQKASDGDVEEDDQVAQRRQPGSSTIVQVQPERWKTVLIAVCLCVVAGIVIGTIVKFRSRTKT
jgi:hypothetical protein